MEICFVHISYVVLGTTTGGTSGDASFAGNMSLMTGQTGNGVAISPAYLNQTQYLNSSGSFNNAYIVPFVPPGGTKIGFQLAQVGANPINPGTYTLNQVFYTRQGPNNV